jgi:hypothetical protein
MVRSGNRTKEGVMRKSLALSAIAMLALAGPAMAGTFSYSLLEAGLIGDSIDDPDDNDDLKGGGLGLHGSWEINRALFGFTDLSGTSYEYRNEPDDRYDFSTGKFGLGLGFHFPMGRRVDFVGAISYQRLRLENDYFDISRNEQGYGIDLGIRGMITERLQWTVYSHYVDYKDDDAGDGDNDKNDRSWSAGFRYYFTRQFAAGIDIGSTDKNQGNALLAFRWDVGNR